MLRKVGWELRWQIRRRIADVRSPRVNYTRGLDKWAGVDLTAIQRAASPGVVLYGGGAVCPPGVRRIPEDVGATPGERLQGIAVVDETTPDATRRRLAALAGEGLGIATLNALRLGIIEPVASRALRLSSVDLDGEYNFKVRSPKLNLLFVDVPKNASSTIKTVLFSLEKGDNVNPAWARYVYHRRWQPAFPDMVVDWADIPWQSYLRFAFVRNPYERILSSYLNSGWRFRHGDKTFREFVAELPDLVQRPNSDMQAMHQKPFGHFVPRVDGELFLDFVGRCESFDDDFNEVLSSAGVTARVSPPVVNASDHAGYREHYDVASRRVVEHLYGDELELGRYTF